VYPLAYFKRTIDDGDARVMAVRDFKERRDEQLTSSELDVTRGLGIFRCAGRPLMSPKESCSYARPFIVEGKHDRVKYKPLGFVEQAPPEHPDSWPEDELAYLEAACQRFNRASLPPPNCAHDKLLKYNNNLMEGFMKSHKECKPAKLKQQDSDPRESGFVSEKRTQDQVAMDAILARLAQQDASIAALQNEVQVLKSSSTHCSKFETAALNSCASTSVSTNTSGSTNTNVSTSREFQNKRKQCLPRQREDNSQTPVVVDYSSVSDSDNDESDAASDDDVFASVARPAQWIGDRYFPAGLTASEEEAAREHLDQERRVKRQRQVAFNERWHAPRNEESHMLVYEGNHKELTKGLRFEIYGKSQAGTHPHSNMYLR